MANDNALRDALKPLADRLFGKQSPYRMKEERHVVRPVGMIVEDLCQIEDIDWARYAFSREPLNGKFDDPKRYELTRQAFACGETVADECAQQYGGSDPLDIAKRLGLLVDYPMMPQNADRVLFAEFRAPNFIYIYMDGLNKAKALFGKPGVTEALGNLQISSLLIAHEVFHFVEEQREKEIWTRTYKIDLWAPKPLRNRSTVSVLSEIAAMGFAKRLTRLPYSPYVMDAFLVYGYSPEAASALYEEMMTFVGRTPRLPVADSIS